MKTWRPVFYSLAVCWLLLGLGSGNRFFFVLFAIHFFLFLAALIMNLWAAFSFTYLQTLSQDNTWRGRPIQLNLTVQNEKTIPYPMMRIRLTTADPQENRQLDFNLASRSNRIFDLQLECPHRGEYAIGMTIIDFIDIFGILRLPFDMRLLPYYRQPILLVYPRLSELAYLPVPVLGSQRFSQQQYATENQHEPFSMVRDYQPGDPLKRIHWKASVRQHKLLTRLYDQPAEPHVLLLLDLQQPDYTMENLLQVIDVCCECAAALVHYLLRQDWPLIISSFGKNRQVRHCHGFKDFQTVYRWLARVPFDGNRPLHVSLAEELAGQPDAQAILLVTADLRPDLLHLLMRYRQKQLPVYTLFACPAHVSTEESTLSAQLAQAGLLAWFIHYGELLEDQLRAAP